MRRSNRGVALPIVVYTLLSLQVLIALVAMAAMHRTREVRLTSDFWRARASAEGGLWETLSRDSLAGQAGSFAAGGAYTTEVRPLGRQSLLVLSRGSVARSGTTVAVGMLLRRPPNTPPLQHALSHRGVLTGTGSVAFVPPSPGDLASCGPPVDGEVGAEIGIPDESLANWAWGPHAIELVDGLVQPGPVVDGEGHCVTGHRLNWGDPRSFQSACGSHIPSVHHAGDLTIVGGMGQGVLHVSGDLTLDAGFRYRGVIVAEGLLHLGIGGATIEGALISLGTGTHRIGGDLTVAPSRCFATMALSAGDSVVMFPDASWIEVL